MNQRVVELRDCRELCKALGLVADRDVDATVVKVFRVVVLDKNGLQSGEVAKRAHVNRITAIHHLKRLDDAGVLDKRGSVYRPRFDDFEKLIEEFEKDFEERFKRARELAKRFDEEFELLRKRRLSEEEFEVDVE